MEGKVATLRGLFPQTDVATLRRALEAHGGDMDRTVETLLVAHLGQQQLPSTKPDAKPTAPSGWTCDRCTFENREGSRRCAMCDAANPTLPQPVTPAASGSPTRKTNDHGDVKIPPWWDGFWAEHRSNAQYDEASAKVLLFSDGRFANSEILTLDIKNRVLRLLGAEEVHRVDASQDDAYAAPPMRRHPHGKR